MLSPFQIIELPVTERHIEREHLIQLKKWKETHGELQYKSPPRLHGAKAISEAEPHSHQALGSRPSIILPTDALVPSKGNKNKLQKEKKQDKGKDSPGNGLIPKENGTPASPEPQTLLKHPEASPHHQSKESLTSRESEDTYL